MREFGHKSSENLPLIKHQPSLIKQWLSVLGSISVAICWKDIQWLRHFGECRDHFTCDHFNTAKTIFHGTELQVLKGMSVTLIACNGINLYLGDLPNDI